MKNKFAYLKKLVETYRLFTKWKGVGVSVNGRMVYVIWYSPKFLKDNNGEFYTLDYTMRTFPKADIGKRITSYKDKIKREYVKRNEK